MPPQPNSFVQPLAVECLPVRVPRHRHTVSRHDISRPALAVLNELRKAGYQAFLVGGGIRDLLLGQQPKDFDVVTNALPTQVKEVFGKQCRLIGRRFLLAHVRYNKEIIEVATFRAHHDKGGDGVTKGNRIVRDNVYGTIDEDAARRDFTINALYYDISDFSILDYADGMADLQTKTLRLIGEPWMRYQEDPVRMLRAARFAAKLGFGLAPSAAEPIYKLGSLLTEVHAARLYEEVIKLFFSGHAAESFEQLFHLDLVKYLFPQTAVCFNDPVALALIRHALQSTDKRIADEKPVAQGFLLAILLWPAVTRLLDRNSEDEDSNQNLLVKATQKVLLEQIRYVAIPRRVTGLMEEIWLLQLRLTPSKFRKRHLKALSHPHFRAAYDFLLLRAAAGENVNYWVEKWSRLLAGETENEVLRPTRAKRARRYSDRKQP